MLACDETLDSESNNSNKTKYIQNVWNELLWNWLIKCVNPDQYITEINDTYLQNVVLKYKDDISNNDEHRTLMITDFKQYVLSKYPHLKIEDIDGDDKKLYIMATVLLFDCCVHCHNGVVHKEICKYLTKYEQKMILKFCEKMTEVDVSMEAVFDAILDALNFETISNSDTLPSLSNELNIAIFNSDFTLSDDPNSSVYSSEQEKPLFSSEIIALPTFVMKQSSQSSGMDNSRKPSSVSLENSEKSQYHRLTPKPIASAEMKHSVVNSIKESSIRTTNNSPEKESDAGFSDVCDENLADIKHMKATKNKFQIKTHEFKDNASKSPENIPQSSTGHPNLQSQTENDKIAVQTKINVNEHLPINCWGTKPRYITNDSGVTDTEFSDANVKPVYAFHQEYRHHARKHGDDYTYYYPHKLLHNHYSHSPISSKHHLAGTHHSHHKRSPHFHETPDLSSEDHMNSLKVAKIMEDYSHRHVDKVKNSQMHNKNINEVKFPDDIVNRKASDKSACIRHKTNDLKRPSPFDTCIRRDSPRQSSLRCHGHSNSISFSPLLNGSIKSTHSTRKPKLKFSDKDLGDTNIMSYLPTSSAVDVNQKSSVNSSACTVHSTVSSEHAASISSKRRRKSKNISTSYTPKDIANISRCKQAVKRFKEKQEFNDRPRKSKEITPSSSIMMDSNNFIAAEVPEYYGDTTDDTVLGTLLCPCENEKLNKGRRWGLTHKPTNQLKMTKRDKLVLDKIKREQVKREMLEHLHSSHDNDTMKFDMSSKAMSKESFKRPVKHVEIDATQNSFTVTKNKSADTIKIPIDQMSNTSRHALKRNSKTGSLCPLTDDIPCPQYCGCSKKFVTNAAVEIGDGFIKNWSYISSENLFKQIRRRWAPKKKAFLMAALFVFVLILAAMLHLPFFKRKKEETKLPDIAKVEKRKFDLEKRSDPDISDYKDETFSEANRNDIRYQYVKPKYFNLQRSPKNMAIERLNWNSHHGPYQLNY